MGALFWIMGVGTPTLIAIACIVGAVGARFYVEQIMPTLGRMLVTVLAVAAGVFLGYANGFSTARKSCNAQTIQTRLDKALMDLEAAKRAAEVAANSIEQLNAAESKNQELVDEIAQLKTPLPQPEEPVQPAPAGPSVPAGPVRDVCSGFTRDDVGRLLRIR